MISEVHVLILNIALFLIGLVQICQNFTRKSHPAQLFCRQSSVASQNGFCWILYTISTGPNRLASIMCDRPKNIEKPKKKIQVWPFLLADVLAKISTLAMFGVLLRVVTGATPLGSTPGFTRMVSECVLESCVSATDKNCWTVFALCKN